MGRVIKAIRKTGKFFTFIITFIAISEFMLAWTTYNVFPKSWQDHSKWWDVGIFIIAGIYAAFKEFEV